MEGNSWLWGETDVGAGRRSAQQSDPASDAARSLPAAIAPPPRPEAPSSPSHAESGADGTGCSRRRTHGSGCVCLSSGQHTDWQAAGSCTGTRKDRATPAPAGERAWPKEGGELFTPQPVREGCAQVSVLLWD